MDSALRINDHLHQSIEGYNNHPLSTESNRIPTQLWWKGLGIAGRRNPNLVADMFDHTSQELKDYDVEDDSLPDIDQQNGVVSVPPVDCPLTGEQLQELQQLVNSLDESKTFAMDLYQTAINFFGGCRQWWKQYS